MNKNNSPIENVKDEHKMLLQRQNIQQNKQVKCLSSSYILPLYRFFQINSQLTKDVRFSKQQWKEIINLAFLNGNMCFDYSVEHFYIHLLKFDGHEACKDIVTDIQCGKCDAIEKFINDIVEYFKK